MGSGILLNALDDSRTKRKNKGENEAEKRNRK